VIESIEIEKLRGIRQGKLEGLTPLTVLVGPNGSGKSTVLDALLIGASPSLEDAIGCAVRRRTERDADARWLLWRRGDEGPASLKVNGSMCECTLSWKPGSTQTHESTLKERGGAPPFNRIHVTLRSRGGGQSVSVLFSANNLWEPTGVQLPEALQVEPQVNLLDMRLGDTGTPLASLYTAVIAQGRRKEVYEILREIILDLESIDILVNIRNEPVLYLTFPDKAVPVALAGDGIRSVLRLSLELAASNSGLVLVEEPEVHQHPRALQQTAKVLMASMRRGLQIVLSTHSLELIDSLLVESTEEDLQRMSIYRLNLNQGALVYSRLSGHEMVFARGRIEEDLR
jgi:predicted ATPase